MVVERVFNFKRFRALFDNVAVGVVAVDTMGEIQAANKCFLLEFGYTEQELLYQNIEMLLPVRFRENHRASRELFAGSEQSMSVSPLKMPMGLKKDGTEFPVRISVGAYKSDGCEYHIAFVNDITKEREADETISRLSAELDQRVKESTRSLHATVDQLSRQIRENERKDSELTQALEKEKELNQLKSRFVSVASHEFRTPLSGILASTYLLSKYTKESDQPQRDKHIKRILSSVNLLNEVLSDFLSVDKMEQENFKPNRTSFKIDDLVAEIIQDLQHMLKEGQNIKYCNSDPDSCAYLDQSMFKHILSNLVSNAIKYSPGGSEIALNINLPAEALVLSIKDQGIGIPEKDIGHLYQRFYRGSNAAQIQGTGLGLNIVKKYVEVLDGTITCISEENKGTEFIVVFKNQKEQDENSIGR